MHIIMASGKILHTVKEDFTPNAGMYSSCLNIVKIKQLDFFEKRIEKGYKSIDLEKSITLLFQLIRNWGVPRAAII